MQTKFREGLSKLQIKDASTIPSVLEAWKKELEGLKAAGQALKASQKQEDIDKLEGLLLLRDDLVR